MKRGFVFLITLLLGACVLHQTAPVTETTQEEKPAQVECEAPEDSKPTPSQAVEDAPVEQAPIIPTLSPEDAYQRGLDQIAAGQFEAAVISLNLAVNAHPNDAKANYALGFAQIKLGEYAPAAISFARAHAGAGEPQMRTKSLVARGYALHALGRYSDAIKAYGVALQEMPNYPKALYNRGCSYGEMGEYDKAIADFSQVLKLDPNYPGARNNLKFYSGEK